MRAAVLRSQQTGQSDGSPARPASVYGWQIHTDGRSIDVHVFESEDAQEKFVEGIERILGRGAEHTAALLAAWAWAEGDSGRELAGRMLERLLEGVSGAALKGLDDLLGRAEETRAEGATSQERMVAKALGQGATKAESHEASKQQPRGFPDLLRGSPLARAPGPERA